MIPRIIPKRELVDGKMYKGYCRNSNIAQWHADRQRFTYLRHKFGQLLDEEINHFEDDNGFDVFIPIEEVEP